MGKIATVLQANMRLSGVNGTAFVDAGVAGLLTNNIGKMLCIRDAAGVVIRGWIKAAGTGETYTDLVVGDDSTFASNTGFWTLNTGWAIGSGVVSFTAGVSSSLNRSNLFSSYQLCKYSVDIIAISVALATVRAGATVFSNFTTTGTKSGYGTVGTGTTNGMAASATTNLTADNLVMQQVLTPSSTGVTIVSTEGGSTYNWTEIGTGFNWNAASYDFAIDGFDAEGYGSFKPLPGAQLNMSHPLSVGLVAAYLFNEGAGNKAHDYSGQGNTGTLTNMANPSTSTSGWVGGPHGAALAFDGGDDYVDTGKMLPTSSFVIAHTIIVSCLATGSGAIVGDFNNTGWRFYFRSGPTIEMSQSRVTTIRRIAVSGTVSLNAQHTMAVIVSFQSGLLSPSYYIDGVARSWSINDPGAGDNIDSATSVNIGRSSSFLNGLISSVMIYNRALSAEEIAYLYAFPYAMFDDVSYPAWLRESSIPHIMNYLRQMRRSA